MFRKLRVTAIKSAVVAILAVPIVVASVGSASASCMLDERSLADKVATSDIVFKGTAVEVTPDGRQATFDVEEVWRGEVAARVVVSGGPEGAATSVDRSFTAGMTYLVFPQPDGATYADNSCSPTQEYDDAAAAARPADAGTPDGAGAPAPTEPAAESRNTMPLILGAVLLAAVGVVAAPIVRQRRNA